MKEHHVATRNAAVISLILFCSSIAVLFVVDNQNDKELIEAVAEERRLDLAANHALEEAHCAQSAESRAITRLAMEGLASQFPDSPIKTRFQTWLRMCIPERDCAVSLVTIPIPENCDEGPSALPLEGAP